MPADVFFKYGPAQLQKQKGLIWSCLVINLCKEQWENWNLMNKIEIIAILNSWWSSCGFQHVPWNEREKNVAKFCGTGNPFHGEIWILKLILNRINQERTSFTINPKPRNSISGFTSTEMLIVSYSIRANHCNWEWLIDLQAAMYH